MSARARLALLAATLAACFVLFAVLGVVSREDVRGWIEPLGAWGAPVYALVSAVLGCLLVPGPVLATLGGVLFGTWLGFAATLASSILSALLGWAVGRRVAEVDHRHRATLQRRGLWAVVVQRLLPGLPDAPFNYAAGSLGIRARDLALGTAIGVAPRAFAWTALGDAVGGGETAGTVASLALLALTAVAGLILARRALSS